MIRKAALCASLCLLASCATPSRPPVADRPAPLTPDPRICADVRKTPPLPAGASVVQPATDEERVALAKFLSWVADVVDAAMENEGRAERARNYACR